MDMEVYFDPSELQPPLGEYDFERNFNRTAARKWMAENWHQSMYIGAVYLIVVFGLQHVMKERRPYDLRGTLTLWSFSLTVFSGIGACRMWKQLAWLLLNKGFKQAVCTLSFFVHPVSKLWVFLFVMSKAVELGDTVFIVLRKKKLIFIHLYHHLVTMVATWYIYKSEVPGLLWVSTFNYSVHFFTYGYYTLTAMGIQVPTFIAMSITTSQMTQMTIFLITNIFVLYWKDDKICYATWPTWFISTSSYVILLILFGNFFFKTYLSSTRKSKRD